MRHKCLNVTDIDSTNIPIKRPTANSKDYFSYKGFFSLALTLYVIILVYSWLWNVGDNVGCRVQKRFANSSVSNVLQEEWLPKTFETIIPGFDMLSQYLIDDPAYHVTSHCMKEHEIYNDNAQVVFI